MKKIILTLFIFCSLVSYSQVKISEMPTTTNPVAAYLPVVRGSTNFKLSTDSLMYRKVDSVKVSNDTVYYYKYAGLRYVAGIISTGTSIDQSLIDSVRSSLYSFSYTVNNDGTIQQHFTDWDGTFRLNTLLSGGGIVSPSNGDLLKYNSISHGWENFAPTYLTGVDTSNISNFSVKVRSLFSATSPVTYSNGVFGLTNTDGITEGSTNKFYTDLRARAAISLTTTGTSGAATYNNSTGVLNVPQYLPSNAGADGSTKGIASFTANDFDASSGNISIDYTNGQKASSSVPGFATTNQVTGSLGVSVDGQGGVISTGSKGFITIPYNCTITNWYVSADVSGSIQFDVKRSGTSIVGGGGNKPLLSSAQSGNAAVSGWTSTTVTAGDIIEWNIDIAATITNATVILKVIK